MGPQHGADAEVTRPARPHLYLVDVSRPVYQLHPSMGPPGPQRRHLALVASVPMTHRSRGSVGLVGIAAGLLLSAAVLAGAAAVSGGEQGPTGPRGVGVNPCAVPPTVVAGGTVILSTACQ